jgi:hypothetical protein
MGAGGGIISAAGAVIGGAIQSDALKGAAAAQQAAIAKELNNVNLGMDPETVNALSVNAGREQAVNQLALQKLVDPNLAATRQAAGADVLKGVEDINNPNSQSNLIARAAVENATTGSQGLDQGKSALIDAALAQLKQGATLPPDVEAQMVQAGLQQGGSATGSASGTGLGGNILRTVLGTAGLNLQAQRQSQAAGLLQQAGVLQQQKQTTLSTLFPSLASTQLANLSGTAGALKLSNDLVPNTGLSATDTANLWLQRVGAQNALYGGSGTVEAQKKIGQGQAWSQAIGTAASDIGSSVSGMGGMGGGMGGGAPVKTGSASAWGPGSPGAGLGSY